MDIEQSYFGTLPDSRDNDADAGNIISPYIGPNTDNGINAAWNNVNTDVIFSLNERTGYSGNIAGNTIICLLYTSPSPRDATLSRMPSSA